MRARLPILLAIAALVLTAHMGLALRAAGAAWQPITLHLFPPVKL